MTANLAKALVEAQRHIKGVHHDKRNSHSGYNYASAENIYRECRDVLLKHGIVVIPSASSVRLDGGTLTIPLEKQMQQITGHAVLWRRYTVAHESGESMDVEQEWPIVPERGRPFDKACASAVTASLSYFLRDLLLLPRVEKGVDLDDEERDEHNGSSRRRSSTGGDATKTGGGDGKPRVNGSKHPAGEAKADGGDALAKALRAVEVAKTKAEREDLYEKMRRKGVLSDEEMAAVRERIFQVNSAAPAANGEAR